ncbi:hypothetical protein DDV96_10455 [Marixanthomonas spongiae]|uniref:Uncharacterized protein n=2 Tax=Marixanthomonas spongiae TaxID=2174845 RepID=A0A2U0HZB3_9FLAO|nr:hypothetical protein DDV96_10455 [Marixanthomonas spongiae]
MTISCSSDNDENIEEESEQQENETTGLIKFEEWKVIDGDLKLRVINEFENSKHIKFSYYHNGELDNYITPEYNSDGFLSKEINHNPTGTILSTASFAYDIEDRITEIIYDSYTETHISFTISFSHNADNTIISEKVLSGNTDTKTFKLNQNGLVYQELIDDNIVTNVTYDGFKPVTLNSDAGDFTYSYETEGKLPYSFKDIYGENPVNPILYANNLEGGFDFLTTDLVSSIVSDESETNFEYTLNENKNPTLTKVYKNGSLVKEFRYFYE